MRLALSRRIQLFAFNVACLLTWPLHAEEDMRCNAETPCPESYVCEHASPPPSDPSGPDTSPPTPVDGEDGFCILMGEERPCMSDADCNASEFCEISGGENCSAPPCMAGDECPPVVCDSPPSEGRCVTRSTQTDGECATDEDCPEGSSCHVSTVSCPAPDCAPDQECPPVECPEENVGFCESTPVSCTQDADCNEGEVCYSADVSDCATEATPCQIDDDGFVVCEESENADSDCESEVVSYCIARYHLACEEDADCGEGFTCQPLEVCECQSAGAEEPGSADSSNAAPEDTCQCESSDEGYCELQEIPCASDDACPGDLVCIFTSTGGATDSVCSVDSNGNESCSSEMADEDDGADASDENVHGFCAPAGGFNENDYPQGAPSANPSSDTDDVNAASDGEELAGASPPDEMDTETGDESTNSVRTMLNCRSSQAPTTTWFFFLSALLLRFRRSR